MAWPKLRPHLLSTTIGSSWYAGRLGLTSPFVTPAPRLWLQIAPGIGRHELKGRDARPSSAVRDMNLIGAAARVSLGLAGASIDPGRAPHLLLIRSAMHDEDGSETTKSGDSVVGFQVKLVACIQLDSLLLDRHSLAAPKVYADFLHLVFRKDGIPRPGRRHRGCPGLKDFSRLRIDKHMPHASRIQSKSRIGI